ncbi:MAG TPA: PLP-dependent aminotransferase family protein [Steroidobacteraceae bacterium]|nr:PLP-dependent aminotransferase family protein [Steroidobacteraceae bacterium]
MSIRKLDAQTRVATIAANLRRRIAAGQLSPGDHMPSVRELARASGVSAFTAARVYDLLVAEGIVDARRGAGYFVAQGAQRLNSRPAPGPEPLADSIWTLRRGYDSRLVRVDAGCGWLPPTWLFADGVRAALTQIARKPSAYAGRYGSVYGLRALRRQLSAGLAQRAIECTEEQIVLTQGASQALELCVNVLVQPGDCVLVDDPCYPHLLAMLRARGIRPIGVPRTAHGPDAAALGVIAAANRPKIFITNSTAHNPTGTTTSPQVAHDVLLAAEQQDFTIVEDDVFAELAPERGSSLASLDRLRRVVYVGSFSKTIAPNLRVGYVVASEERAQQIAALKNIISLSSSELTEQMVLSILTSGRHRTHLERLRKRLAKAQESVMRRFQSAGVEIAFRGSGLFLWARLPSSLDSGELIPLAKARGILLAPGEMFRPDSRSTGHYRFNVAYANDDQLYAFIDSLGR